MRDWKNSRAVKAATFYSMPNLQSGIGAFIGLISLSLVWATRFPRYEMIVPVDPGIYLLPAHHWGWQSQYTIFGLMQHAGHDALIYGAMFIIGAIIALASPIGGILQGMGLVGVAFQMESLFNNPFILHRFYIAMGPGYLLAVVSTLLVLTSVSVIRTANHGRPARALSRFAALSPGSMSAFR